MICEANFQKLLGRFIDSILFAKFIAINHFFASDFTYFAL
jgi:hypothetical protein